MWASSDNEGENGASIVPETFTRLTDLFRVHTAQQILYVL